jgi:dUTP pyrophosphatase
MSLGVYLAQPIDQTNLVGWGTEAAADWLSSQPQVSWIYDPKSAFRVGLGSRTPAIRSINTVALEQADLLIAFLPAGTVSVGVPMEIQAAVADGKPTLVISDAPSWSLHFEQGKNVRVMPSWDIEARLWVQVRLDRMTGKATTTTTVWQDMMERVMTPVAQDGTSEPLADRGPTRMPVLVSEGSEAPRRGYADDAGLDLIVSQDKVVLPGEFVDIPCGVQVELPAWSFGLLTGRSSTLRKRGLLVNQGIIDAGYRGPLFAGVWNMTDHEVQVHKGERLAQLIILENSTRLVEPVPVLMLADGSRGHHGFGSTGV